MELIMQDCELGYLERIYSQQIPMEETAELIVPDKSADAVQIIDAFGTLILKDSQWEQGTVKVNGSIRSCVLFLTEEGQIERLEAELPFSLRRELPEESGQGVMELHCRLCSMDARILNSRKLLLRGGLCCSVELLRKETKILRSVEEPSEALQLRIGEYPMKLPVEQGEKSFTVNDEPELGEMAAPIARILKAVCSPKILDQKAVGGKGVFKMELHVHILYADPEEKLHSYDWKLPISQYVDFPRDVEGAQLQTSLHITDLDIEPDSRTQSRRLFLRIGLLAHCMVYEVRNVRVIEDAYCTDGLLQPKWQQWNWRSLLDSRQMVTEARHKEEMDISSVVEAHAYPMQWEAYRQEDCLKVKIPVCCNVIYYDTQGKLCGKSLRMEAEVEQLVHQRVETAVRALRCSQVYCSAASGTLELRVPMELRLDSFAMEELRSLEQAEIEELPTSMERKPALILRRTEGEEELWDIAKSYRTAVEGIRKVNELEDDRIPDNTMLLIPL